ncbi:MAG: M28 family peptidase [Planctomycetota bacterium]
MAAALVDLLSIAPLCAAGNRAGSATSPALNAALESVHQEALRADLFFIAADELAGRETPGPGLRIAARFLRARLERLGIEPGGPEHSYFYKFPLEKNTLDFDQCRIEFAGRTLHLWQDYFLSFGSAAARDVSASIVFAGDAKIEDLEKIDAAGKWLLILDRDQDLQRVRRALSRKQLAGTIYVPAADYAGKPYAERFADQVERMKQARYAPVVADGEPGSGGRPRGSGSIYLGPEAKQALFAAAQVDEAKLEVGAAIPLELKETRVLRAAEPPVDVEDVCGFWPGSDPLLKNDVILVTAHYDHVGVGRDGQVYNGADDNGSGTCGLLALAEMLTKYGPMRRSIMIMWVCGEEKGLWGSAAWTRHPYLPDGCKAVADINIDMIGRNDPDKLLITPTEAHEKFNFLSKLACKLAADEGFPKLGSADEYYQRSDHFNFVRAGIPAAFLFSGVHEDYHQPTDDPDKIDYDKMRRVVRLVFRMLDGLQNDQIDQE